MDPRRGGPHQFIDNFIDASKHKIKNKIIINGKKKNINLVFFRNSGRFLYLFEVMINFIKILYFFSKKKKLNNNIVLNIHGFYNFSPLIFAFFSKKKINWFIHEEIKQKFFFIFSLVPRKFNIFFLYDFKDIKLKKKSNFFIIKPSVNTNFWKLPNQTININTFLTIGNLNPLKNHNLLLKSSLEVNKKIKIFIAGEKLNSHKKYFSNILSLKEYVEKNSKTKIFLLGKLSKQLIKKKLSLTDFYVMTSRSEGTPFALLEAMSCGKICIIPKINTLDKLLINGHNGFYFRDNDVKSLSSVLTKVLRLSKKKKINIGARARNLISKYYSNEVFANNIKVNFIKDYA